MIVLIGVACLTANRKLCVDTLFTPGLQIAAERSEL